MNEAGRIAIVTGASMGIGWATAEALARAGFKVFGTSRRPVNDGPRGVSMHACDVTDEDSVNAFVSSVLADAGQIDLLVNNAGIGLIGGAEESSASQVQALFDVNVFGVMRVTNAVLPAMRRRRQGRIINMSSIVGLVPGPYSAHYSASKHAIEGYSESLDHELRAFNIRVALVEPAGTRTVFEQNSFQPDLKLQEYDEGRSGALALLREQGMIGDPPEVVARAVIAAATDRRLRRRYPAGKTAKQVSSLRRFAPAGVFDAILRKVMHMPA